MDKPFVTNDKLGRPIRDLRISITDRCNFRCFYCMPKELFGSEHAFVDRKLLLSFEEIERVARIFLHYHGIKKIRITGGEPLIRRNIERLIEALAAHSELEDLSLTTNGSLLTRSKAQALKDAGLKRLTVSLDALDDRIFKAINDVRFPTATVLEAIEHAETVGLGPVKVNMVVTRGINESEILPMVRYFHGTNVILRFIEYMDVGNSNDWKLDKVVSAAEIANIVQQEFPITPVGRNYQSEVASRWRYEDGEGELGIISSVTEPFCGDCSRVRLSAEGMMFTCLFASKGFDIRKLLRSDLDDHGVADRVRAVWRQRDDRYSEIRTEQTSQMPKIEMSYIGG